MMDPQLLLDLPSAAWHGVDFGTCWALPQCPSPAWGQGSDGQGRTAVSHLPLEVHAQLCGVPVPYPVDAGGIAAGM